MRFKPALAGAFFFRLLALLSMSSGESEMALSPQDSSIPPLAMSRTEVFDAIVYER